MGKLVSVVIINYNGVNDTVECVYSLLRCTYKNIKIIIVDNNSKDKITYNDIVTKENCKIIYNNLNIGFAGANNIGIKYALEVYESDYVLILNNDTVVERNFLEPLINTLEQKKNIGIASGKIYYFDNPELLYYGGGYYIPKNHICDIDGFQQKEDEQHNFEKEVPYATGCMWLIPCHIFNEVGYLCEDFFLYYEDNDYCERIKENGYLIYYVPDSIIYHKEGRSSKKNVDLYNYYLIRNYLLYIKRNVKNDNVLKCKLIIKKIITSFYNVLKRTLPFRVAFYAIWDFFFLNFGKTNRF